MKKKHSYILMVILLLIIPFIIFLSSINNLKKNNNIINYTYKYEENTINFYNNKKLINKYKCNTEDCHIYAYETNYAFSKESPVTIIKDGNNIFMYDFNNKEKITKDFSNIKFIYNKNIITNYIVTLNNKDGIIDLNGNIIVEHKYDEILDNYIYDRNLIVVKNDNKYGLINISKDNVVENIIYENIKIENNIIKGLINETWETL